MEHSPVSLFDCFREAILILDLQYHGINSHIFHYACKFGSVSISVEGFLFANLQSNFLRVMFEEKI